MLIDYAEKLYKILRDKYDFSEEEARGFAEGFRPFLEMPLEPNTIHATDIFRKLDTERYPRMVRAWLTAMYRAFKQEGGNISLDRHTINIPNPDEKIPQTPPTSTSQ